MAKRQKGTGIPGLTFSWKRALGITKTKQYLARQTGVPTSKAGVERKIWTLLFDLFLKKK